MGLQDSQAQAVAGIQSPYKTWTDFVRQDKKEVNDMDLGIMIALGVVAFGFGVWFLRIGNRLDKLDKSLIPLILLHKRELIDYYLEKGILPNPGMTPRKQYLMERLQSNTISVAEYHELLGLLNREKNEAQRTNNTDALVAILGLIALIAILASLSKR